MDNFNDPIIQDLAKAYTNMLKESHKHEELIKLSNEELNDLVDEYTKKAAESEGEEKEHHEKELADIKSILASRKDDKEEVKEEAEDHLGAAHSALKAAGEHYNSFDRGYESGAVPHMKRAKAALAKARAAGHDTKEADARYKDIHDRIDAPHRKELEEVYRLTPGRAAVLDNADKKAADALNASVGSTDPKVKKRAHTELSKSLRGEILRQRTKPQGERSGAWAGTTDAELENHLKWARKSQLGESAKEIVQNISEWMKTMKGKKNGKSK